MSKEEVQPKRVPIIEVKPSKDSYVKCCECRKLHKIRNVANGSKFCPSCWNLTYGVKRRIGK
jgi:hypothetical protein